MYIVRKEQSYWSGESRQRTGQIHQANLWSGCIVNSPILRVFCPHTKLRSEVVE